MMPPRSRVESMATDIEGISESFVPRLDVLWLEIKEQAAALLRISPYERVRGTSTSLKDARLWSAHGQHIG